MPSAGRTPRPRFDLAVGTSREAVTGLLEGRTDMAVLTRELEPEERGVMVKGGMELEGYRFARDAICVVVNPSNPVENIAADDLRRIYLGEIHDWTRARRADRDASSRSCRAPEGDLMASFVQRVMGGQAPDGARVPRGDGFRCRRSRAPLASARSASSRWRGPTAGRSLLRVSALTGLPYWKADAEKVYNGEYPLTRSCNLYVRAGGARLANGLVTWVASIDGQKIVHEAGLVPTEVPVRFARRSPMLGSH